MESLVNSVTSALLGHALNAATVRHQVIAHNIANANTPGYKTLDVSFERSLSDAKAALLNAKRTDAPLSVAYVPVFDIVEADDGNGGEVALDTEVAKLSENTLHHQVLLKALNRHFSLLNTAINEGKR